MKHVSMDDVLFAPISTDDISANILRRAKDRICHPYLWCQGRLAVGNQMCSLMAVMDAMGITITDADSQRGFNQTVPIKTLADTMDQLAGTDSGNELGAICDFNNSHTHSEVMHAFDKAIETLERRG